MTALRSSVRLRARIIPPNPEYELYKISQALLKFRFFRVKRLKKSLFRVLLVKFEVLGCFLFSFKVKNNQKMKNKFWQNFLKFRYFFQTLFMVTTFSLQTKYIWKICWVASFSIWLEVLKRQPWKVFAKSNKA